MGTTNITVRTIKRAIPGNALTITDNVTVAVDLSQGEEARRKAIVTAIIASDSTSSTTNGIHYNAQPIPVWDYPAGHTF